MGAPAERTIVEIHCQRGDLGYQQQPVSDVGRAARARRRRSCFGVLAEMAFNAPCRLSASSSSFTFAASSARSASMLLPLRTALWSFVRIVFCGAEMTVSPRTPDSADAERERRAGRIMSNDATSCDCLGASPRGEARKTDLFLVTGSELRVELLDLRLLLL